MTRAWRLCRSVWADTAFDGEGARRHPGRWNRGGVPAVYTAATISLAVLEILVHTDADLLPADLVAIPVDIPDDVSIESRDAADLPADWRRVPHPDATRELGTAWLAGATAAVLALPSAVVPPERILLVNPRHPDLARLVIGRPEPFALDPRLW